MFILVATQTTQWVFNVQQLFGFSLKWFPMVSLPIFLIVVIWAIWDLCKKLEESENHLPSISVEPNHFQASSWYLKVVNNGEKADFSATVTFIESTGVGQKYDALWLETMTNEKTLKNGDDGMLQIALIKTTHNQDYFVMNGYDTVKKSPKVVRRIEYERFLNRCNTDVQVIISAYPKFKGGKPFIKTYTLGSRFLIESKYQPERLDGFPLDAVFPDDNCIGVKN